MVSQPTRESLVLHASWASKKIHQYLDTILDAFDYCVHHKVAQTELEKVQLNDATTSLLSLSELPRLLANELVAWQHNSPCTFTPAGLELNIINEMQVHMLTLMKFAQLNDIPLEDVNVQDIQLHFDTIRSVNRMLRSSPLGAK